ncbi:very short patch repair endonuclease [Fictibacillus sp. KU28468]|uniref:very short patch repair endonuclease n=1 Tax=Fictibacillus sp. KU28468 TaxID=2991053 RepID=UPI00223D658C|nr:very short patch repair endonuclease [Fictibacillus sp. KU28468]UZJ78607.1 very short patch repair endonuclease [Fictibacillus sp. KU28468]
MGERITKEQRRKNMQAIRSQSKLENRVTKRLWHRGLRFRKNDRTLFGKPDISIKKYNIVIFIDSCFWHACELHGNRPNNNRDYWDKKLERNRSRDIEVNQYYLNKHWHIKRVWEHELKEDFNHVTQELFNFINNIKKELSEADNP